jgi:hypothetical protein
MLGVRLASTELAANGKGKLAPIRRICGYALVLLLLIALQLIRHQLLPRLANQSSSSFRSTLSTRGERRTEGMSPLATIAYAVDLDTRSRSPSSSMRMKRGTC